MSVAANRIDIGKDFTRFPAGRTYEDGPFSGQRFREEQLKPYLDRKLELVVCLDSALGYGSSFLEEAFGGLVRQGYSKSEIKRLIRLETKKPALKEEILGYIEDASPLDV